jgi:hypothetical protein
MNLTSHHLTLNVNKVKKKNFNAYLSDIFEQFGSQKIAQERKKWFKEENYSSV